MAAEWEQGKTWRELVDIHVGHLLAGEADHHGVRSRPIKSLLDEAERDLAQARAEAAKYRAALELIKLQSSRAFVHWCENNGVEIDGSPFEVIIARAALEPAP